MASKPQDGYTDVPLSPLSSHAWEEWESWHTISTSQSYLNDTSKFDRAEDLKTLSTSLSHHTAQSTQKNSRPLDDQTLGQWLDAAIAKTSALLAEGRMALVSEIGDVVSKTFCFEESLLSSSVETGCKGVSSLDAQLAGVVSSKRMVFGGKCRLRI